MDEEALEMGGRDRKCTVKDIKVGGSKEKFVVGEGKRGVEVSDQGKIPGTVEGKGREEGSGREKETLNEGNMVPDWGHTCKEKEEDLKEERGWKEWEHTEDSAGQDSELCLGCRCIVQYQPIPICSH